MKRKLTFMILAMMFALLSTNLAWGAEITFNPASDQTFPKDGITISVTDGTLTNGTDYRVYKNQTMTISSTVGNITKIEFTYSSTNYDGGGWASTYTPNAASWTSPTANGEQARITQIKVTTAGSTKTLTSLVISGTPNKTTYEAGEEFDPAGLVVTGTYDDESTAEITSGITWDVTPNPLTAGTTSVSVTATVDNITSEAYVVDGLTVNAALPKITITADKIADFASSYAEYMWTANDVSGKCWAYRGGSSGSYNIQFNKTTYVYNTTAVPGRITSIKMTKVFGTTRSWSIYGADEALTGDNYTTAGTQIGSAQEVSSEIGTTWNVPNDKNYTYFYITKADGGTNIGEIVITYEEAPNVPVTGVTLNTGELSLNVGATETLTATVAPDDATNKNVTWSSNKESVATVSESGVVTAVAAGTATITVTTEDGNKTASCNVTVTLNKLATPTNLQATNVTSTSATLTWDEVENASSYEVKLNGETKTAETNSLLVEELTASTTYTWTVKAKGDNTTYSDSDESVESSFTTPAIPTVAYTVTFDGNEHGTPASESIKETEAGAGVTLPDCTPNTGYQFVGWATTSDATEADAGVAGEPYYPTDDITLYAVYNQVYTITWSVNGTPTTEGNPTTSVVAGEGITTLPTTPADISEMKFQGWTATQIETPSTTAPTDLFTDAEHAPAITANTTFYAVFAEKSEGDVTWNNVTTLAGITEGTYVLVSEKTANTYKYMPNTESSGSNPTLGGGITIDNNVLTNEIADNMPWSLVSTGTTNEYYIRPYGNNEIGLGTTNSTGTNIRVSSSYKDTKWTIATNDKANWQINNNNTTSMYLAVYSDDAWRNYSNSTTNQNGKFYFFKKTQDITYTYYTNVVVKDLTSISLSGDYPIEFWKGETFSHEGMMVTAHYSNAPDADVTDKAEFTGYDMATAGEQTVTVTYDTQSTTYSITVRTIANTQETAYTVTEAKSLIDANPAELTTTKVYVKGTVSEVDGINDGAITYWLDNNTFEVYKGKNVGDEAFTNVNQISVNDDVIIYGKIKKYYSTYEFDAGNYLVSHAKASTLSIGDITVEINGDITPVIETNVVGSYTMSYTSDNENVVLADGDEMVTMGLGTATITAILKAGGYKDATTTFEVKVIKALSSIAVKEHPTTLEYKEGDKFNPAGLVITANYNDESTEDVAYAGNEDKFTFTPSLETPLTTENTSVTITYAGKEATQTITVHALYTYDITWMANGEQFTTTQVTEGDALALPETNPDNIGDMIFQGWINTDNYYDAETAPEYIVPSEIIPTAAMTFYAVYAKESAGETTSVTKDIIAEAGLTSSVTLNADNNPYQMGVLPITLTGIKGQSNFPALNYHATNGTDLRFYKGTTCGVTFATTNNSTITKIEFKKNTSTASTLGSTFSANVGTLTGNVWTGSAGSVTISYSADATFKEQMYIINVTYSETSVPTYSNFCTTVKLIDEDETISENATWEGNYTINGNTVTIGSGAVLTVNGALINTDPENLIIEDGAQLIVNNSGVQATVKKNIDYSRASKESNVNWHTISSPLANSVEFTEVENLIPSSGVTGTDYDLYYLDEENGMWINSRIYGTGDETIIANDKFTKIKKGVGYIYHREESKTLAFAGEVNVADVECTLTNSVTNGFNLIGNPFTQNIELANVTGVTLAKGFYVLTNQNTWGVKIETRSIAPLQGFLVQVDGETGGTATIEKPAAPSSKGERSAEQVTNIEMIVSNSSYRDNAFAMFGEGTGLNKVNHRNAQAPMLYVPQDGEDFAIAFMDENTTVFPLNFKAMTTGNYSISLKPTDDINTLVLVDNMTGVETNMLLEGSYSFIGSPADNDSRFTVKLSISHNSDQTDSEHFVYQNGSELVVNGEGTLQVFDVLGRVVLSEEVHGQRVYVGNLSEGAYIVRMTGNEIKTQKIIIR